MRKRWGKDINRVFVHWKSIGTSQGIGEKVDTAVKYLREVLVPGRFYSLQDVFSMYTWDIPDEDQLGGDDFARLFFIFISQVCVVDGRILLGYPHQPTLLSQENGNHSK